MRFKKSKIEQSKKDRNRYDKKNEFTLYNFGDLLRELKIIKIYKETYRYLNDNKKTLDPIIYKKLGKISKKLHYEGMSDTTLSLLYSKSRSDKIFAKARNNTSLNRKRCSITIGNFILENHNTIEFMLEIKLVIKKENTKKRIRKIRQRRMPQKLQKNK